MNPQATPQNDSQDFVLPEGDGGQQAAPSQDAAADLIRSKVHSAYQNEPDAAETALDTAELGPNAHLTKHQKFIAELTTSGKSLEEIQNEWHQYYAALPDGEKHAVWEEFYDAHAKSSKLAVVAPALAPKRAHKAAVLPDEPPIPRRPSKKTRRGAKTVAELREHLLGTVAPGKLKPRQHLSSLMFGLAVGAIVLLVFLFGFFNERFIAPFIQPSRTVTNTPIISDSVAGADPEIIIPKINVEIPVVYGVKTVNEDRVNEALESGVVHYADTSLPGEQGNAVIVGHSSNNIFNKGKYKFAFVLLSRLEEGDTFYLEKDGKRYTYQVFEKKIVKPTDVSVLTSGPKPSTVTLITCDPPGTTINRLVVVGEQIDPDPSSNTAKSSSGSLVAQASSIPGDAPTLWSRFVSWLF